MTNLDIIFKSVLIRKNEIQSIGFTIDNNHERLTKVNLIRKIKSLQNDFNLNLVTKSGITVSLIKDKYLRNDNLVITEDNLSELESY